MVETLNIHSIVFEITNRLGFGKDAGLIIAILIFLILMTLDHAYVLLGSKAFLVLSLGVGLLSTLLFYVSAEQVNLGNAPETTRLICLMGRMLLFSTAMVVSCRLLKIKVLDPIAKKNMQREFEKI